MQRGWRGFYINLDGSPDRRAAMEAQIERAGLTGLYERFPAVTGAQRPAACRLRPGQYGCFRSHHDLLAGIVPDGRFIHVVEDDSVLARGFGPALQSVVAAGMMKPFDLVFTETMIGADLALIRMLKTLFDRSVGDGRPLSLSLLDLETTDFAGTTSYLVNPRSLGRVAGALKRGLAAGPVRPVDLHLRDEVHAGRLRAGLLFPYLSSVNMKLPSTVGAENTSSAASLLLRNAFFVEADVAASRRAMSDIMRSLGPWPEDPRLDLLADILRFYVTDRFRPF